MQGHRYLQIVYLIFLLSATSGHVIFAISPLPIIQWVKIQLPYIYLTRALLGLWIFHRLLGGGGGLNASHDLGFRSS